MRPVIIITLLVFFIISMDLYALRGIQYLFSRPGWKPSVLLHILGSHTSDDDCTDH